ncbi:MAG: hypothetical protein MJE68_29715 [Proteobacteria bacterium]|nr:hypothetical protein [Pseudomonadota bacterium]
MLSPPNSSKLTSLLTSVLRLPVAHLELNAIELAWSVVKGYVAKHNWKFTLKEVEALVPQAIGTYSSYVEKIFAIIPYRES